MDIYKQRSQWKVAITVAGSILLLVTIIYSNYLSEKLAEHERGKLELFRTGVETMQHGDVEELGMALELVEQLNNVPVIQKFEDGYLVGFNINGEPMVQGEDEQENLEKRLDAILRSEIPPIESDGSIFYYEYSRLYSFITYFPIVQGTLVALFITLGYFLFSTSKRAEQNRVWAGMAKETAHQLGTPISAIMAWIEYLKESNPNDEHQLEILDELSSDVNRLNLVADRFSKIGSKPELKDEGIANILEESISYMQMRAPKRVEFTFKNDIPEDEGVVNKHLFQWVIENLYRNALDAMENNGEIRTHVYKDKDDLIIDIRDSGKGIPNNKHKTVFQPGYSTKKRGWGLGLSLAKRIIEQYHKGKIFVKNSKINEGTTFTIKLKNLDA